MLEFTSRPHRRISGGFISRARTSLAGLVAGLREDRSIRELWLVWLFGLGALALARPQSFWWAFCLVAGSLAAAVEYLNAALEAALDRLHPERDPLIGLAKDLASAAAFLMNVAALGVLVLALSAA